MNQNTAEYEYLSLIVNYSYFLGRTILKEEHFEGKDRLMFRALIEEYNNSKELIVSELVKNKNFDPVYYSELMTNNLHFSNRETAFKKLERIIINNYKNRLIKIVINSYNGDVENFLKKIDIIKNIKVIENEFITAEDILNTLEKEETQIKLGLKNLDDNFRVEKNDFVIVGGGTGTGKTTFALNLLSNLSKKYKCVYFNMEMSKKLLYKRLSAIETQINIDKFNNLKGMSQNEMQIFLNKISEIDERKITLINNSQNIDNIEKIISNINDKKNIVVILDHLGLINCDGKNLYERMTNVAKKIRGICLDYDCTIIGLCQLNRDAQKKQERPTRNDLRDSGELEQSARKIILLHNKDADNQKDIKDINLLIAKNDDGYFLEMEMKFHTKTQKFYEKY